MRSHVVEVPSEFMIFPLYRPYLHDDPIHGTFKWHPFIKHDPASDFSSLNSIPQEEFQDMRAICLIP